MLHQAIHQHNLIGIHKKQPPTAFTSTQNHANHTVTGISADLQHPH
jgi:hypothetical protein